MQPMELERLFERLWGDRWRKQAALELDVNDSTITRWVNGTMPPRGPVLAWARERQLRWEREQQANRRNRTYRAKKQQMRTSDHGS